MAMKRVNFILILPLLLTSRSRTGRLNSAKSLLVQQLQYTHDKQDWFVPTKQALEGLTKKQACWTGSTENHCFAELVTHLSFWNERLLRAFKGEPMPNFDNNNDFTITSTNWVSATSRLNSLQVAWEHSVKAASAKKLNKWNSEILNLAAHTAYNTGQIIHNRKQNGWWH